MSQPGEIGELYVRGPSLMRGYWGQPAKTRPARRWSGTRSGQSPTSSHFRHQAGKRTEVARNLQVVLGNELTAAAAQQVTREWFRLASCETVDVKRLRGRARSLRRLVEFRGREHLEAALAAGKGAILCTGHFGSCSSGFSVLHAST